MTDRRSRLWRWLRWPGIALVVVTCVSGAAAEPPSKEQRACIAGVHRAFARVANAKARAVARCLDRDRKGKGATTLDACVASDDDRKLGRAMRRTLRVAASRCGAPAPTFGYASGEVANGEASAAGVDLVHDLLGTPLDAAIATGTAGKCQQTLVDRASDCARAFIDDYGRCAKDALQDGAESASALVACKGADTRGKVTKACESRINAALSGKRCRDQDPGALLPGCATADVAICLRGHARAAASWAINGAAGLCTAPGPPPPDPEPIDVTTVPLPPTITSVSFPWWTTDGSRILASAEPTGFARSQIVTIAPDGSDLRCLTCPIATDDTPQLLKPIPFPDGQRVMVRVGAQSPLSAADHGVLECTPSVLDCQTAELVPIEIPFADEPGVLQDQREFRVAPDGVHIGFSQGRGESVENLEFVSIVGTLDRQADHYAILDPRVVSTLGELKQFGNDGTSVYVAAFVTSPFQAGNPDTVQVSLVDGTIVNRTTSHPAYDEPVEPSPDDGWFVVGSGRGAGLVDTLSQLPRPPIITRAISNMTFFFFLTAREASLEPWLVDRYGARGDYIGQPLNPGSLDEGWDTRSIVNWHPDGTHLVWWQRATDPGSLPPGQIGSRVQVAMLSARSPITSPVVPAAMPSLAWAPSLEGYELPPLPPPTTMAGAHSGTAEVSFAPGEPNQLAITYTEFSDDGMSFVDGTEMATYTPGTGGSSLYDADVTLRGCRQGFLEATSTTISAVALEGRIVSEVDGNLLSLP